MGLGRAREEHAPLVSPHRQKCDKRAWQIHVPGGGTRFSNKFPFCFLLRSRPSQASTGRNIRKTAAVSSAPPNAQFRHATLRGQVL